MKKTVQAILGRMDRQAIDAQLASLLEKEKKLAEVKDALSESRDKTPMLDRLNPFKTTEAEKEIKQHKTERNQIQREATEIRKELETAVRIAIADEPKAQIAISLSKLKMHIKDVESEASKIPQAPDANLDPLQNCMLDCQTAMDELTDQLRDLVGIEREILTEQRIIDATLEELR